MPAAIWKKPLALLSGNRRVVALDPRGQGESEIPTEGYTLERRAQDIAEFVDRYPGVVLVCWSLGALETLEYLRVHGTSKISGLAIIDSSVGEGEEPAAPAEGGGFQAQLRRDRAGTIDGFVRAIFRTPQLEAELEALREGALRMPLESSLSLFPGNRIPREQWRNTVRAFDKPLLYVVTPQFAAQAADLKRNRPRTRVEVFKEAGHALFVDEPERFSILLREFVAPLGRHPMRD
jgi:microsomal epoxide hydrolase